MEMLWLTWVNGALWWALLRETEVCTFRVPLQSRSVDRNHQLGSFKYFQDKWKSKKNNNFKVKITRVGQDGVAQWWSVNPFFSSKFIYLSLLSVGLPFISYIPILKSSGGFSCQ